MAKARAHPSWQRAVIVTAGVVVAAVVVACLYFAQEIFIPVALAAFLTFLLSPLVSALQRRGLGRVPSVIIVAVLTAVVLSAFAWVVTRQVVDLAEGLPKYSENIKGKVRSLREVFQGTTGGQLRQMFDDIVGELGMKSPAAEGAAPAPRPEPPSWLAQPLATLSSVSRLLTTFGMTAVLLLFMLLNREDLRNRLIRLVGHGRITLTTKAVDEAGHRISRFLIMQAIINCTYGVIVAAALALIGVDHWLLWGILAALLRYVPYVGVWIAILPPILLSLAQFPGWWRPSLVIGLYVVLELVTVNVVEPKLYGKSIGVSEVALLVAAAFWAWMWGPIGLVLSSPLTVVLVVLGKYVPHLEFLDVLLGDEPPLEPDVAFYQRLLARDQDEALDVALAQAKAAGPERVYDELTVPVLTYVRRDLERDEVTEADEHFIQMAMREIIEDLGQAAREAAPAPAAAQPQAKVRVLGCPARDEADGLALEMLQQLLDPARWDLEIVSSEMLTAELLDHAADRRPAVICVAALPPGGLAHTRYLCKRLRQRLADVKIVVGRWGLRAGVEQNVEQLHEAGADLVDTTLLETRHHLTAWLPVLAGLEAKANGGADGAAAARRELVQAR
jgi:predicted PurR-regulated permease PerM